jgi:uncharacterized repeat protein (TIGR03837 family)
VFAIPFLPQDRYDVLLWACDLNFVRGEDSFVRAQWAGRPFVWQIYAQQDDAHRTKLLAFLDRLLAGADEVLAASLRALWLGWNGFAPLPGSLPPQGPWQVACSAWQASLAVAPDLVTQLLRQLPETR